ncbi:MAG: hypothetical protein LAT55_12210 [Opitutales bacterium]|nr:hypothetical protein [Opitutales bacterium]
MFANFRPIGSGASIRRSSSYGGRYGSSPITEALPVAGERFIFPTYFPLPLLFHGVLLTWSYMQRFPWKFLVGSLMILVGGLLWVSAETAETPEVDNAETSPESGETASAGHDQAETPEDATGEDAPEPSPEDFEELPEVPGEEDPVEPVEERQAEGPRSASTLLRGEDRPEFDGTDPVQIVVIPVVDGITRPVQFAMRRGLREASTNGADVVVLDMNTPGGGLNVTLEMMEMLARFDGRTMTYVNPDAISAGAFIASATEEIFFAPRGRMGAAAPVMGSGEEIPETAMAKIMSYLRGTVEAYGEGIRYRPEVLRAMFDIDYELVIEGEVLKPAGELLTLTAARAVEEYGDPPHPLLAMGIYEDLDAMFLDLYGEGNYEVTYFEISWSESVAQYLSLIAPLLIAGGIICIYLEAQSPGFGFFGIVGVVLMMLFFGTNFISGLAGHEPMILFFIGLVLILVEVIFLPGVLFLMIPGFLLVVASLIWSLTDYWPQEGVDFDPSLLFWPTLNVFLGIALAVLGILAMIRYMPRSILLDRLVLASAVDGVSQESGRDPNDFGGRTTGGFQWPEPGTKGVAISGLYPSGEVEIDDRRYQASAEAGTISPGEEIEVVGRGTFALIVKKI